MNSGSQICGLFDVKPAQFGKSQQVVELASNFGDYNEVYNGFDVTDDRAREEGCTSPPA